MEDKLSNKIERYRSRLDALAAGEAVSAGPPSESALAACRSALEKLRELKREALAELIAIRRDVQEEAHGSLTGPKSLRELWERRDEGARRLLRDVRRRVIGLVDQEDAAAIEALARVNEEIDARLENLAKLERRLARDLEKDVGSRPERRTTASRETADDELYAAVGAEVRKGRDRGAFCPHCGRAVEPDDRFCGRCGHRLAAGE